MDCEKFDHVVLDLLYGELDELTQASARRHTEHCARCKAIFTELRATRQVGSMPLVDPPEGLELRILEAERQARAGLPLRQRLGRGISVLAGYAMRPQLAMAALLMLVIGSSLMILRARPGHRESVLVTERGVPESENELALPLPEPAAEAFADKAEAKSRSMNAVPAAASPPSPVATASAADDGEDPYSFAMKLFDEGRYSEARSQFQSIANRGGSEAATSALFAARAASHLEGCVSASSEFEQVAAHYPGTPTGLEATWLAAECHRTLGEGERARHGYEALLETDYAIRARAALEKLDEAPVASEAVASRKAKAAAEPAEASGVGAAAAPPPAKPGTKAASPAKSDKAANSF